jgi:hypothetical protein
MWLYNGVGLEALRMVVYGGGASAQILHMKPLGSCGAILHSKDSLYDGKILRMGHYAVILQPYFRFVLKGRSACQ